MSSIVLFAEFYEFMINIYLFSLICDLVRPSSTHLKLERILSNKHSLLRNRIIFLFDTQLIVFKVRIL